MFSPQYRASVSAADLILDELGHMAFAVFNWVCRRCGKDNQCYESIPNMASRLKMGTSSVRKSLRQLVQIGVLDIEHRTGYSDVYHVTALGRGGSSLDNAVPLPLSDLAGVAPPLSKPIGVPLSDLAGVPLSKSEPEVIQDLSNTNKEVVVVKDSPTASTTTTTSFIKEDGDPLGDRFYSKEVYDSIEDYRSFKSWIQDNYPQVQWGGILALVKKEGVFNQARVKFLGSAAPGSVGSVSPTCQNNTDSVSSPAYRELSEIDQLWHQGSPAWQHAVNKRCKEATGKGWLECEPKERMNATMGFRSEFSYSSYGVKMPLAEADGWLSSLFNANMMLERRSSRPDPSNPATMPVIPFPSPVGAKMAS